MFVEQKCCVTNSYTPYIKCPKTHIYFTSSFSYTLDKTTPSNYNGHLQKTGATAHQDSSHCVGVDLVPSCNVSGSTKVHTMRQVVQTPIMTAMRLWTSDSFILRIFALKHLIITDILKNKSICLYQHLTTIDIPMICINLLVNYYWWSTIALTLCMCLDTCHINS